MDYQGAMDYILANDTLRILLYIYIGFTVMVFVYQMLGHFDKEKAWVKK